MKMLMQRLAMAVAITVASSGITSAQEIVVEKDIEYRKAGETSLKLNIARPKEGSGPFPCLVWIHGGGWAGGARDSFQGPIEESARKGYVAATISYRLTDAKPKTPATKHPSPAQIHDCKAAVRWLKSNAAKYQLDPDRIGVIGASAGGHLSLLVGLSDSDDGLEGDPEPNAPSSRVQAVVNIFGPTEMTSHHDGAPDVRYLIEGLCGGTPQDVPGKYKAASPITYLSKDDPPILTFHGDADKIVPVQQAELLEKECEAQGVSHELVVFEKQGHGFAPEYWQKVSKQGFEFFDKHLKAKSNP